MRKRIIDDNDHIGGNAVKKRIIDDDDVGNDMRMMITSSLIIDNDDVGNAMQL